MKLKNLVLQGAGFLCLALGAIGLFLPIWPTTPFVLLAAACFAHNPRLHARMLKIPFFREYIVNYRDRNGLPKRIVTKSLAFLWGMLILTVVLTRKWWLMLILVAIGAAVTAHILTIAKPRKEKDA